MNSLDQADCENVSVNEGLEQLYGITHVGVEVTTREHVVDPRALAGQTAPFTTEHFNVARVSLGFDAECHAQYMAGLLAKYSQFSGFNQNVDELSFDLSQECALQVYEKDNSPFDPVDPGLVAKGEIYESFAIYLWNLLYDSCYEVPASDVRQICDNIIPPYEDQNQTR